MQRTKYLNYLNAQHLIFRWLSTLTYSHTHERNCNFVSKSTSNDLYDEPCTLLAHWSIAGISFSHCRKKSVAITINLFTTFTVGTEWKSALLPKWTNDDGKLLVYGWIWCRVKCSLQDERVILCMKWMFIWTRFRSELVKRSSKWFDAHTPDDATTTMTHMWKWLFGFTINRRKFKRPEKKCFPFSRHLQKFHTQTQTRLEKMLLLINTRFPCKILQMECQQTIFAFRRSFLSLFNRLKSNADEQKKTLENGFANGTERQRKESLIESNNTTLTIDTDFNPLGNGWRNSIRSDTQICAHVQSRYSRDFQRFAFPFWNCISTQPEKRQK